MEINQCKKPGNKGQVFGCGGIKAIRAQIANTLALVPCFRWDMRAVRVMGNILYVCY